jgi:hypothetical protein
MHNGNWSRLEAQNNQRILYVFTDNTDRDSGNEPVNPESRYAQRYAKNEDGTERRLRYPKYQTSAVLRGLDNAMPVSTQRWYHGEGLVLEVFQLGPSQPVFPSF